MRTIPRSLDDAIVSPTWLRRVAGWWERRDNARPNRTDAMLLAWCDQASHNVIVTEHAGQYGRWVLLARPHWTDAQLLDESRITMRDKAGAWYGTKPDTLRWLAEHVRDGNIIVVVDATIHHWWKIESIDWTVSRMS